MDELLENFRHNIRAALDRQSLTQRDVASRSGLHEVSLSLILSGKLSPKINTCERIAKAVGVSPQKMFLVKTSKVLLTT